MSPFDWSGDGARILVVDDQEPNRLLLREMLESHGCVVSEIAEGDAAVTRAREEMPDLILLDVNMPGIGGLEVCRLLKAAPETAGIPVLLVTALSHREDRLRGIEAGANDYLTKPFDRNELGLRVRNAVSLRRLHLRTEDQFRRLRELESLRDGLVHMLVHDLRTPLTGIRLYLEMLRDDAIALEGGPQFVELVDEANSISTRMTEMVNDMLDTSRLESGAMPLECVDSDISILVREAIELVGTRGRRRQVDVEADAIGMVQCDPGVIRRVVANLIGNAVDFSPDGRPVRVRIDRVADGFARVQVSDDGPGISAEYHERIFDKFGQLDAARSHVKHSTGLGLTFCKLAVTAHGGRIGVESAPGSGSTFWFVLPPECVLRAS